MIVVLCFMWILLSPETLVAPDQIRIKPPHQTSTAVPQSGDRKKPRTIGRHTQTF